MTTHRLDDTQPHAFWDNSYPARLTVASGDVVVFETLEGTGQIAPESTAEALAQFDSELVHPLTGPVYVEGAEPGGVLEVEVLELEHKGWGWNGVLPGFGLLADEFSEPYLHHYELMGRECLFRPDIRIPFEPFCGVMGVAPARARALRHGSAARERRQRRHPPPHRGDDCPPPGARRGRALLVRRLPRGAG